MSWHYNELLTKKPSFYPFFPQADYCMANRLHIYNQSSTLQRCISHGCRKGLITLGRLSYSNIAAKGKQAVPHTGFYADILSEVASRPRNLDSPPNEALNKEEKAERLEKAKVVFGSRLVGPAERQDQIDRESKLIAGVLVPPRPSEPDNCCMSGCVNCVWDRYREDLEEWAMKSSEARARMRSQSLSPMTVTPEKPGSLSNPTIQSVDDDGGGSQSNWDSFLGSDVDGDLLKDVPIGIREFMKIEKSLKEKRLMQPNSSPP